MGRMCPDITEPWKYDQPKGVSTRFFPKYFGIGGMITNNQLLTCKMKRRASIIRIGSNR